MLKLKIVHLFSLGNMFLHMFLSNRMSAIRLVTLVLTIYLLELLLVIGKDNEDELRLWFESTKKNADASWTGTPKRSRDSMHFKKTIFERDLIRQNKRNKGFPRWIRNLFALFFRLTRGSDAEIPALKCMLFPCYLILWIRSYSNCALQSSTISKRNKNRIPTNVKAAS